MAKNTIQVTRSFLVAAVVCFVIGAIICFIGVLVLSINPNLPSQGVIKYLVSDYAAVGLKGIILAGVMAMVMSTVDSYINATAVIIVHDFCKPFILFPMQLIALSLSLFVTCRSLRLTNSLQ